MIYTALPTLNPNPDWSAVIEQARSCVHTPHKDDPQYVWEAVMTALYGSDFWVLYNERNS